MKGDSVLSLLSGLRTGFGFDVQAITDGEPFTLGGALIDLPRGLAGGGDGDAVCRSLIEALLSSCGMPDLEMIFPEDDPSWHREGSFTLLSQTVAALKRVKLRTILSANIRIVAELPELNGELTRMQLLVAEALQVDPTQVGVSWGGNRYFDAVGRGEALVTFASLLCVVKGDYEQPGAAAPPRIDHLFDTDPPGTAPTHITELEELEEPMSERRKSFEKALKTGLPPLPRAAAPREGSALIAYTDGASRGNPGASAVAFVVLNEMGELVHEDSRVIGTATNNQAEYEALIDALKWIQQNLGTDFRVQVRSDSELMVRQVAGEWKIKDEGLKQKALVAMNILLDFSHFQIKYVPRAENKRADKLCNMALDGQ